MEENQENQVATVKKKKFTLRQQRYKKNRILGMSQYNAAVAAGYSPNTAKQACKIENIVKYSLADAFEQAGLTDKAIIAHALKGLEALKIQACDVYVFKDENGKWKVNEEKNEFVEVEDWHVRHKYFETILKLLNKIKEQNLGVSVNVFPNRTFVFSDVKKDDSADRTENIHVREGAASIGSAEQTQ